MQHRNAPLALFMSFVLSFSLMGVPAYADDSISSQKPIEETDSGFLSGLEQGNPDSGNIATEEEALGEATDFSSKQQSNTSALEDTVTRESAKNDKVDKDADATKVAASDVVEFVYLDESVIALGKEQSIAFGLKDDTVSIEYARLDLERLDTGEAIEIEATAFADGSALFTKTFEDKNNATTYQLKGIRYDTTDGVYYADLTSGEGDQAYSFDVVTQSVADALEKSSEVSEDGDVSAFAIGNDGSLVAAESVEAAIQTADAEGVSNTAAGESIVDQEMLDAGITGEEDAEIDAATQDGASSVKGFFSSIFGTKDAWAAASSARENYLIVALDPGHGGSDSGAVGYGLDEKSVNLSIAQYCYSELGTYSGVTPYLTRSSDEYVGLQERVDRALSFGADVFISIHCNSTGYGNAQGAEVWVPNGSSFNYGAHVDGQELGEKIVNKLASLGLANRGVKVRDSENVNGEGPFYYPDGSIQDYYSVIESSREAGIPGIIVEHAFIDNASDASKLASDSFRNQLGQADATGVAEKYGLLKDSAAKASSTVQVKAHISNLGWESAVYDQKVAGTTGKSFGLEAFQLSTQNSVASSGGITYRSYVGNDWQDWQSDGATSGTTGLGTALQAVQIKLTGAAASQYDVYYRVHVSGFGWLGWAKNGASAGSLGYDYNAEAIEVAIVNKGGVAPGDTTTPLKTKAETLRYQAHVASIGWQSAVDMGETAGTVGQSLAIEALNVSIADRATEGSIQYNVQCSGTGWQGWKSDGATAGTTGQAIQTEAIQIKLTGELAQKYDVYYSVHSQGFGWLGWAKNGETAGTEGYGYSMQAIQIKLVKKGETAPGPTENHNYIAAITYQAHVSGIGWQDGVFDGDIAGTTGQARAIEALNVSIADRATEGSIQYNVQCSGTGWQGWKSDGATAGTTGQAIQTEAIQIKLTGELAQKYDVYYSVHSQGFGWLGWAKNGETAGTEGYGYSMQAIQIKLVKKGETAPGPTENHNYTLGVGYQTHVSGIGWQAEVFDGDIAGTTGQSKAIEALSLTLKDKTYSGDISYRVHCSGLGWQDWKSDGATAGTTGQAIQTEAVSIALTGEVAKYYDVYYQVHSQGFGWLGWAKNGENAGTQGYGYRLEAVRVKLVPKGNDAPGSTENTFHQIESASSTSIIGYSQTTVENMVSRYNSTGKVYPSSVYAKYGASNIEQFCTILKQEADDEGVRAEVLFSQVMVETGWLQFGGDVRADQCNFGGIGATGGVPGNSFNDWGLDSVRKGLRAQTQHLKAYASTNALNKACVDPRFGYVKRGCAPTIEGLTGTWAASPTYANSLLTQMNALLAY